MDKSFILKADDQRPAKYGWAPGDYMRNCIECKKTFFGDKRAIHCADCAYGFDKENKVN